MTTSERNRLSSVMMSSVVPSAKYSCSASPLMLSNGSTAIVGLSEDFETDGLSTAASPCRFTWYTWTGRSIFLTRCSPRSRQSRSSLPVKFAMSSLPVDHEASEVELAGEVQEAAKIATQQGARAALPHRTRFARRHLDRDGRVLDAKSAAESATGFGRVELVEG